MSGSLTSPKRQRVNTLRLIHSLARRACILNGFREHGAVQLGTLLKTNLAINQSHHNSSCEGVAFEGSVATA